MTNKWKLVINAHLGLVCAHSALWIDYGCVLKAMRDELIPWNIKTDLTCMAFGIFMFLETFVFCKLFLLFEKKHESNYKQNK